MNAGEHDAFRRDLGVYVLGALEPAERDRFERHLEQCETCRDEVAHLAVLPAMLARAGGVQTEDGAAGPPPVGHVVQRIAKERRRARQRVRWFAAGTALMAGLAAVVLVTTLTPSPGTAAVVYRGEANGVDATVEERAWGMAVHIAARDLPRRPGYVAVAVAQDGHRTQVASWTDTGRAVAIDGSCYLEPDEVSRMEILAAPDDEVLAVLHAEP